MANSRKNRFSGPAAQIARPSISKRRQWIYRFAAIFLSPLIFFFSLEGILHLVGFGYPTGFFLHRTDDGKQHVIENNKFGWRFFGPALARTPYPLNFTDQKPPDTVRIFVFGESAAYGDPQPDFGMPRILEVLLRERYPGVHFEVINVAMVAINSNVILPIARDCSREHGDIWLVYMGNNEVVGPFGSGTVFGAQVPPLPLIRANLMLKSTRTGELLSALLARAHGDGAASAEWRGMMMFVQNQVRQDDPRMARVYGHFARNLTDILRVGVDSGAKVIVSTVASNLKDCAPFGSQHAPGLTLAESNEWSRLYQAGIEAEAETNETREAESYARAAKLDDHFADLQFRWARACLALGHEDEARKHFVLARDYDTLRFRADSRINDIIRDTATNAVNRGVSLLDAARTLASRSPHGICGEEFFYEHVHFTFRGNYALARLFGDQIATVLSAEVKRRADPDGQWLTAEECANRLGWNAWSEHQVLKSLQINVPPFNFQLNHAEMLQRVHRQTERLAQDLTPSVLRQTADDYRQLISARPGDWVFEKRLAEVLQDLGDLNGAAEHWRRVESLVPQSADAPLQLNLILLTQGKLDEAADEYDKAVRLDRNFAEDSYAKLLNKIGGRALENNNANAAVPFLRQAISLRPNFAEAHISLGTALNALGNTNEAREEFRAALRHPPTTPLGLFSLGKVCHQEGWTNEAIRNFQAALSLDPTDGTAHFYLGKVLLESQKTSEARREFEEAVRLDPRDKEAKEILSRMTADHPRAF